MKNLIGAALGVSLALAAAGAVVGVLGLAIESPALAQAGAWMTAPILVMWALLVAAMAIGIAANIATWLTGASLRAAAHLRAQFSRD